MNSEWSQGSVSTLQAAGLILVEDGNHGESRPRPHEFAPSGIAFIRAADIDSNGNVLFDRASKISMVARERITKGIGAPGDILLTHKGTVGKVGRVPVDAAPFVCSPQTTFWRSLAPNAIDQRYLHAYLRSPFFHQQLVARAGETDMAPYVSLTSQRAIIVRYPPLPEQRAIAHILGTLDDKIELNRRTNETLEAMARALFKSWFVDFDPVHANKAGRKPEGMDAETAALFPDDFEDSEMGKIPRGWKPRPLYETATWTNGAAYRDIEFCDAGAGLPVVKIAELKAGVTAQTKHSAASPGKKYEINTGDVLFSWSGNPDTSIDTFVWSLGHAYLNQHIFKVSFASPAERTFGLCNLRQLRPTFAEIARDKQTTGLGHVTGADLRRLRVCWASQKVLQAYHSQVEPMIGRQLNLDLHSRTLAALRDALLPQLLSGSLRVPEAMRLVEKAI